GGGPSFADCRAPVKALHGPATSDFSATIVRAILCGDKYRYFQPEPTRRRRCAQEETVMKRTKPPFRADEVGSLLRTKPIVEARQKREAGTISAAELTEVEDAEIIKIIKKQEEVGLQLATDGEFRR